MAFIWNGVTALGSVTAVIISVAAFIRFGRGRQTEAEWDAQRAIADAARGYLRELKRGRPDRPGPGRGTFPPDYASLRGQAELAETILERTPDLGARARKTVLTTLHDLVGEKTVAVADVGVEPQGPIMAVGDGPVIGVDPFEDVQLHILRDYHDGIGCKQENRVQCERDHYPQVRQEYGEHGLLWLTVQGPHYQHFEQQYLTAVACLDRLL